MIRIFTITWLIMLSQLLFSQGKLNPIEIGQPAEQVKAYIEWITEDHNKPDSYGNRSNSKWEWDANYNNGKILNVTQCFQNEYLIDIGVVSNYCKYYIMENDKLAFVISQFENISITKLVKSYTSNYGNNKLGEFYFSDDFEYYSKVYLSDQGLATIERRKTVISELPNVIQQKVQNNLSSTRQNWKNEQEEMVKQKLQSNKLEKKEQMQTIVACEDFSAGLALVGIDSEHLSDDTNFGYGKKLYGFIDNQGNYVIEPKYEKANSFRDGFALVNKTNSDYRNSWEFINTSGENTFNKKFEEARSFSEGLAVVKVENKGYGFINQNGELICKAQYEEVGDFKEGFARVRFQKKWGFIDKTGKETIYPQFTTARDYKDGMALVSQFINYHFTQFSYVNTKGDIAIKLERGETPVFSSDNSNYDKNKMETQFCDFNDGLAILSLSRRVYVNKEGKAIIKPKNKNGGCHRFLFYHYVNDLAIAEECGSFGYLNKDGKWEIKPIFDDLGNFHDGLAKVKINDNWGFIDKSGDVVINKDLLNSKNEIQKNAPYDKVSDFSEGIAIVQTRGKIGYIDKSGKWIVEPNLIGAAPFVNGIARVKYSERKGWNYIDKKGNILFPKFL